MVEPGAPGQRPPRPEGRTDDGRDAQDAIVPGAPGQMLPGSPGQLDRGAVGQMDRDAPNPWAPGADTVQDDPSDTARPASRAPEDLP